MSSTSSNTSTIATFVFTSFALVLVSFCAISDNVCPLKGQECGNRHIMLYYVLSTGNGGMIVCTHDVLVCTARMPKHARVSTSVISE